MATRGRHRRSVRRRQGMASILTVLVVVVGASVAVLATRGAGPATTTTTTSSTAPPTSSTSTTAPTTTTSPSVVATTTTTPGLNGPGLGLAVPLTLRATGHGALSGLVIAIDPGHDGGNYAHASYINHLVWNGRAKETCDTTGTATDAGYTEALFNWNVAINLESDLRRLGATVVLTRS